MTPPVTRSRFVNLDVARGFAIFAMIVAHTAVFTDPRAIKGLGFVEGTLSGLAAPLFAAVMGVTLGIMSGGSTLLDRSVRWRFRGQMAIRGIILILLGLALDPFPSGAAIVLDYLGFTLLLATMLVFLPTTWLVGIISALLIAGPIINAWGQQVWLANVLWLRPPNPLYYLLDWTATGHSYRATELLPLMLLGVIVARIGVENRRVAAIATGAGIAMYVASAVIRRTVLPGPVTSGSYVDLLGDFGTTLGAFGVISLLVNAATPWLRTWSRRLTRPLDYGGRVSLSIYVLHILVLSAIRAPSLETGMPILPLSSSWIIMPAVIVLCFVFAWLWVRFVGEGPIEFAMGLATGRRTLRRARPEPGAIR